MSDGEGGIRFSGREICNLRWVDDSPRGEPREGGGGGGATAPNAEPTQDNRTVCERMADDAQRMADAAIRQNGNVNGRGAAFHKFNHTFGEITFGSYIGPSPLGFLGAGASSRSDVLGHRDYRGDSGFPRNFRDTINPGEDQVHHFGAYFSAGLTGHKVAPDIHRREDRNNRNRGDVQLADQSRRLGDYLRRNPQQLANVGNLISTICGGGAVP